VRLHLFALAYNLRSLVLPDQVAQWSLTTLRKIGARIVRHDRYVIFQVAVPRALFAAILRRIDRLRGPPVPAM
jgi:hypothetical protein